MVDLGPIDPDDPRAIAARHKRDTQPRTYSYVQTYRYPWDVPGKTEARQVRYIVHVKSGHVRTERYDPERGSGPNLQRVELPLDLPLMIKLPMAVFVVAMAVILAFLPLPLALPAIFLWSLLGWVQLTRKVERARMAKYLRRLPDPPPLLSDGDLDARIFQLANPDEDRTFDDPAPIPMPSSLRDRAWQRWADRLAELPDQEYRVGQATYRIKQGHGSSARTDHAVFEFVYEIRRQAASLSDTVTVWNGGDHASMRVAREDHPDLRPLFESLGREVLGDERVAELEDHRRAAEHDEPMLDRRFAARTDCGDGHVGEHPILSTFTDSLGRKRVRRSCSWCPSVWSERV